MAPTSCITCDHAASLHNDHGCHVEGCACDELRLPEVAPNVPPPKPGACIHIMGEGAVWVVEEIAEVDEKLDGNSEFVELTACDFEERKFCMYPVRVRPQAVMTYHGFLAERWDRVLEAVGRQESARGDRAH